MAVDHPGAGAALSWAEYPLGEPEAIATPRLLVFRERVERNIARMRGLLEGVVGSAGGRAGGGSTAPGSGFRHLRTHVKTHKAAWAARLQIERGIEKFKATPNELDMLLAAGARDILVSYPLLPHAADQLARRIVENPAARIRAQAGAAAHVRILAEAAGRAGAAIETSIDLDVGMQRTGAPAERAVEIYRGIARAAPRLEFGGIHAYDGHNKGKTEAERRAVSEEAMARVLAAAAALESAGARVPRIVAGGSPGFLADLEILLERAPRGAEVEVSPGTWIYWDSNYDARMPGMFELAALILARVMDRPGKDRVTLDLGYKRWAIDAGPVERFSEPGLEVAGTSEEHTVLRELPGIARPRRLEIGDAVLIAPRHICSTVNLWESFAVIGPAGEVEIADCPVDARNR